MNYLFIDLYFFNAILILYAQTFCNFDFVNFYYHSSFFSPQIGRDSFISISCMKVILVKKSFFKFSPFNTYIYEYTQYSFKMKYCSEHTTTWLYLF